MKITEIRNKLFGLSDLKGLIKENAFSEARDSAFARFGHGHTWYGFFEEDPRRLDMSFLQLFGFNRAPAEPLTVDQLGDCEIKKYFSDDEINFMLSNPINFQKSKGIGNSYAISKSNYRKRIQGADLSLSDMQNNGNEFGDKPQTIDGNEPTLSNSWVDNLYYYFVKNGGNRIKFSYDAESGEKNINEYLNTLISLSNTVFNESSIPRFFENQFSLNPNILVGNISDPFAMFLFIYYTLHCQKRGTVNRKELYYKNLSDSLESIGAPVDITLQKINDLLFPKNTIGGAAKKLQELFLEPLGLTFAEEITNDNISILCRTYFSNESTVIDFWKTLNSSSVGNGVQLNNDYVGMLGSVLASAAYILLFNKGVSIDALGTNLSTLIPSGGYEKAIRSLVYYVKYKTEFAGKFARNIEVLKDELPQLFGVATIYDLFDPLSTINNAEIASALKSAIGISDNGINEGRFEFDDNLNSKTIKSKLQFFSSFGLPQYDAVFNLTPFERFIDMAKGGYELLSEDLKFDAYGGDTYALVSNIFKSASQVYGEDTGAIQKIESLKSDAENVYGEDLTYGQLITYDISQKDKTQREIYRFLISNLPGTIKERYEYNRAPNKLDNSLGNQSVDILCTTYTGKMVDETWIEKAENAGDKTLCVEYQGEGHFRPRFVRPKDYSNNPEDGVLYWATEIFKDIMSQYDEYASKIKSRWFKDDMTEDMIKTSFEKYYKDLTGVVFKETYLQFNPFLTELDTFRGETTLKEAKDVQADEDIFILPNGRTNIEIIQYLYAMLLQIYNLPIKEETEIPPGFILKRGNKRGNKERALSRVYPAKKAGYTINYVLSMHRFSEEIHTIGQKVSDKDKSNLIKERNWSLLYILPTESLQTTTEEDFKDTQQLANPSSFVFRWDTDNQETILSTIKNYLAKPAKQLSENSLFRSIVKELFDDNNFQLS